MIVKMEGFIVKYKKLFKRAQDVKTLGRFVLVTIQAEGVDKFSSERKQLVYSKLRNLFQSLSEHPDYVGCFERGFTMFNDYAFGIACSEEHAESLKRTISRFAKGYNFDTILACGRFETMVYSNEDSEYYGRHLYDLLLKAHRFGGIGKRYYARIKGLK